MGQEAKVAAPGLGSPNGQAGIEPARYSHRSIPGGAGGGGGRGAGFGCRGHLQQDQAKDAAAN
ncbi:hypothetical protein D3C75_1148390 [compost metagenome]